jgi:hypothetical protein
MHKEWETKLAGDDVVNGKGKKGGVTLIDIPVNPKRPKTSMSNWATNGNSDEEDEEKDEEKDEEEKDEEKDEEEKDEEEKDEEKDEEEKDEEKDEEEKDEEEKDEEEDGEPDSKMTKADVETRIQAIRTTFMKLLTKYTEQKESINRLKGNLIAIGVPIEDHNTLDDALTKALRDANEKVVAAEKKVNSTQEIVTKTQKELAETQEALDQTLENVEAQEKARAQTIEQTEAQKQALINKQRELEAAIEKAAQAQQKLQMDLENTQETLKQTQAETIDHAEAQEQALLQKQQELEAAIKKAAQAQQELQRELEQTQTQTTEQTESQKQALLQKQQELQTAQEQVALAQQELQTAQEQAAIAQQEFDTATAAAKQKGNANALTITDLQTSLQAVQAEKEQLENKIRNLHLQIQQEQEERNNVIQRKTDELAEAQRLVSEQEQLVETQQSHSAEQDKKTKELRNAVEELQKAKERLEIQNNEEKERAKKEMDQLNEKLHTTEAKKTSLQEDHDNAIKECRGQLATLQLQIEEYRTKENDTKASIKTIIDLVSPGDYNGVENTTAELLQKLADSIKLIKNNKTDMEQKMTSLLQSNKEKLVKDLKYCGKSIEINIDIDDGDSNLETMEKQFMQLYTKYEEIIKLGNEACDKAEQNMQALMRLDKEERDKLTTVDLKTAEAEDNSSDGSKHMKNIMENFNVLYEAYTLALQSISKNKDVSVKQQDELNKEKEKVTQLQKQQAEKELKWVEEQKVSDAAMKDIKDREEALLQELQEKQEKESNMSTWIENLGKTVKELKEDDRVMNENYKKMINTVEKERAEKVQMEAEIEKERAEKAQMEAELGELQKQEAMRLQMEEEERNRLQKQKDRELELNRERENIDSRQKVTKDTEHPDIVMAPLELGTPTEEYYKITIDPAQQHEQFQFRIYNFICKISDHLKMAGLDAKKLKYETILSPENHIYARFDLSDAEFQNTFVDAKQTDDIKFPLFLIANNERKDELVGADRYNDIESYSGDLYLLLLNTKVTVEDFLSIDKPKKPFPKKTLSNPLPKGKGKGTIDTISLQNNNFIGYLTKLYMVKTFRVMSYRYYLKNKSHESENSSSENSSLLKVIFFDGIMTFFVCTSIFNGKLRNMSLLDTLLSELCILAYVILLKDKWGKGYASDIITGFIYSPFFLIKNINGNSS